MADATAVLRHGAGLDDHTYAELPITQQIPAPSRPSAGRPGPRPQQVFQQPIPRTPAIRVSGAPFGAEVAPPRFAKQQVGPSDEPRTALDPVKAWVGLYVAHTLPMLFAGIFLAVWGLREPGFAGNAGFAVGFALCALGLLFAATAVGAFCLRDRLPTPPKGPIRGVRTLFRLFVRRSGQFA